jgi:hypothetical protein
VLESSGLICLDNFCFSVLHPNRLIAAWAAVKTKQGWASQGIAEQTAQGKENGKSGAIIARVFSYP